MSRRRFLALLTQSEDLRARTSKRAIADGLEPLFETAELVFYGAPGAPRRLLPRGAGIIWGDLLGPAPVQSLSDLGPRALLDRQWGGYLAVQPEGGKVHVLRDPSAAVSCYYARARDAWVLASDAATGLLVEDLRPSIDWNAVAAHLLYWEARQQKTSLAPFEELLPGMTACFGTTGVTSELAWHPERYAATRADAAEAPGLLRRCLLETIGGWVRQFRHPLLELSGGLDSSIVAAGLASAEANWDALSFAAAGSDLNEIAHARSVAASFGLELTVREPRAEQVDVAHSDAALLPRPRARSFNQACDRLSADVAHSVGADAFFTGIGGDSVFCYVTSVAPVLDRLAQDGTLAAWRTADDLARLCRVSRSEVVAKTLRRLLQRRIPKSWFWSPELMARAAIGDTAAPPIHPWLAACARCHPGTIAHVAAVLRIHNYLEGHARANLAPVVAPLLAQPVLECCLSIPSWQWCGGGRNRAVARAAFADLLPPSILARRTKGSFDGFGSRILERNRDKLREMLLEGLLARRGLLDRPALEYLLQTNAPVPARFVTRILTLADTEAWAQSWHARAGG